MQGSGSVCVALLAWSCIGYRLLQGAPAAPAPPPGPGLKDFRLRNPNPGIEGGPPLMQYMDGTDKILKKCSIDL
jgi:hypothetical protein